MSKKAEIERIVERTITYVYLFKKSAFDFEELDRWYREGEIESYYDHCDKYYTREFEAIEFGEKCNDGTINPSEWYMYFLEFLA